MLQSLSRTVLKIVVASLIVGTVLTHFRHHHRQRHAGRRALAATSGGAGGARLALGVAQPSARDAGDRADVVGGLHLPATGHAQPVTSFVGRVSTTESERL